MKKNGSVVATLVYDGDGQRVKTTFGSTTTVYVGGYYEQQGSTIRKYYYAGGQRMAMRVGTSTVYYLLVDHLGSTAITANSSGTRVAELRYYAYGGTRYTYGTTPTAYKFTGQRLDDSTGLYYYGARYYDPVLGRLVQADTIVPDPGNPQALNRYAYVLNNPVRYTDPTGHCIPGVNCPGDKGQNDPIVSGSNPYDAHIIVTSQGIYIDTAHYSGGRNTARRIYAGIDSGRQFPVYRASTAEQYGVRVRVGLRLTYSVDSGLSPNQRAGVALGIFMDSSRSFESFQGLPPSSHSSFAFEDQPSDYLGFYAETTETTLDEILYELGPSWQSAQKPADAPMNPAFTPFVQDESGQWVNVPWPEPLNITPIGSASGLWSCQSVEIVVRVEIPSYGYGSGWITVLP